MKKLLLLLFLLPILICVPLLVLSQQTTYIPDDDFEQHLINEGYDNVLDDFVMTSAIDTVSELYLGFFISTISDLTGLEDFTLLKILLISPSLNLTTIDVSQNTLLESLSINGNQLTSLDVSQNTLLESLSINGNQLTSLDVSNNTSLTYLNCSNNQLTSLDFSNNPYMWLIYASGNQLTSVDIRNGNNLALSTDNEFQNNPQLYCIDVNSVAYCNTTITLIDPQTIFSTNCSGTSVEEQTTKKELIKVIDLLGRETKETNQPLFYIYDDGTVEKNIVIE